MPNSWRHNRGLHPVQRRRRSIPPLLQIHKTLLRTSSLVVHALLRCRLHIRTFGTDEPERRVRAAGGTFLVHGGTVLSFGDAKGAESVEPATDHHGSTCGKNRYSSRKIDTVVPFIAQRTITATATAATTTTSTKATMSLFSFFIITFFCIAGSTSAYEAFKDNLASIRAEAKAYCKSPAEYETSEGGKTYGPIGGWNVSAVTSMKNLFRKNSHRGFRTCNPPISEWDVGAVKNFFGMFYEATGFNQDLSGWDVGNGRNFEGMFNRAATFNQDLSWWDVGNGRIFANMFYEAVVFNQDLSWWDVGNGRDFYGMFYGAAAFNQDLSWWDVGNGQSFGSMFNGAVAFNQDLSRWDVGNGRYFVSPRRI